MIIQIPMIYQRKTVKSQEEVFQNIFRSLVNLHEFDVKIQHVCSSYTGI